ncbi:hypothetical protein [Actinoplanes sp. NPDC020271]|uniref:hypothetical protein n=1 Tax=Actinoplanes sp. NPDC020271 TaxID=3363896 RepID=UPI0037A5076E
MQLPLQHLLFAVDRWIVTHPQRQRQFLKPFLSWAAHAGHLPRLHVAAHRPGQRSPITQHRRIGLLHKLIADDTSELRTRVAAILLLLYAQPLGRILSLTIDTTGPDVLLHLGDPPTPVPEPVAELLLALRDQRTNMRTATNRNARWLFPRRRAGQPLTTRTITPLIRDLGVPTVPGRLAALHQLVLQAPAPVVAQALGFHHTTTQRHHAAAGGTWNRYTGSTEVD